MLNSMENQGPAPHFKGKDAISHVIDAQKEGIISSSEVHGQEPSGFRVAFIDALRDTALFLLLVSSPLFFIHLPLRERLNLVLFTAAGWIVWKTGRSALLGWSRLERLHRIVEQERWEIEHHRQQERAELAELYRAKGFSGQLLEDVIDVLMSDADRLLRVMIEEELGLSLEKQEHPILQAWGAFLGSIVAALILIPTYIYLPPFVLVLFAAILFLLAGYLLAEANDNQKIPGSIWHLGLGMLSFGLTYFLFSGFR